MSLVKRIDKNSKNNFRLIKDSKTKLHYLLIKKPRLLIKSFNFFIKLRTSPYCYSIVKRNKSD